MLHVDDCDLEALPEELQACRAAGPGRPRGDLAEGVQRSGEDHQLLVLGEPEYRVLSRDDPENVAALGPPPHDPTLDRDHAAFREVRRVALIVESGKICIRVDVVGLIRVDSVASNEDDRHCAEPEGAHPCRSGPVCQHHNTTLRRSVRVVAVGPLSRVENRPADSLGARDGGDHAVRAHGKKGQIFPARPELQFALQDLCPGRDEFLLIQIE